MLEFSTSLCICFSLDICLKSSTRTDALQLYDLWTFLVSCNMVERQFYFCFHLGN